MYLISLMNMNITANQPASPMPHAHAHAPVCEYFAPCSMACSKTVANSLAFALYLPNEIDACSFSGPEHFSPGLR